MDFATEVCDSCGEQFCANCLVYPRGTKKPPFCTNCAMALSGVRNRRPVKPLSRGEIKKRRKQLKTDIDSRGGAEPDIAFPGTDLIEGPELEPETVAVESTESGGMMNRFRRRKTDLPPPPDEIEPEDLPEPIVTVVGAAEFDAAEFDEEELPPPPAPADEDDAFAQAPPEHSSATAILEQLKEQGAAGEEDDVWTPSNQVESTPWTLPEISQSPLGGASPWESVATTATEAADATATADDFEAPVFVSEADLRASGPADTDTSGNWVPPTLRGMAPQARSNGSELPRRRRSDG
ncbi:MAG: hypothetical protein HKN24_01560 [Acidimicrobiales bacterium]|nr:hypothetical protein [Acidimicrobiales bacterium]